MDELRQKGGKKALIIAVTANCFLTALNIIVGLLSGSYALISEGGHTFSDIVTSVIAYIGFRTAQKPADDEHPLGHGRAEAISGLIIVIFLVVIAWEVMEGAVRHILVPASITVPDTYAAIMAIVGIIVNLRVSEKIIKIGRNIRSPAIVADGKHQRTDIFSSVAILAGVIGSNMGLPILDPIVGFIIGLLILKTAGEVLIENLNHIMGTVPSQEFIQRIKDAAESNPQAQNAHNIKVDYLGTYAIVSLHVELDGNLILVESHKIAHEIEKEIVKQIPEIKYVVIHTCPIGTEYEHKQEIDK